MKRENIALPISGTLVNLNQVSDKLLLMALSLQLFQLVTLIW